MIKANELRKGVLIIDYNGIVREVYGEDIQQQCWYEEGQSGTTEAPLNPIPLTPEWLERCRFEKERYADVKDTGEWDVKEKWISQDKELELFYVVLAGKEMTGDNASFARKMKGFHRYQPVKHVHQLQNLYFTLTGEELNLKP